MIKKLTVCLIAALLVGLSVQAQEKNKQGFTKEEFRQKQEQYLTQKAELTKEEAERFFPMYFELQDRKKELSDKAWAKARKNKDVQMTEADYEAIIDGLVKARMASDQLDWDYLQKFKEILSAKKIYKLQRAEMKFHRDLMKIMHQGEGNKDKKK